MRDELKGSTPEELEQAAKEAREARVRYWDERFVDETDDLADLQPVKVKVVRKLGARATVGLRLAADELALIEKTAQARGVTFSEFVRDAALAAASANVSAETEEKARLITDMRLALHAFEAALADVEPGNMSGSTRAATSTPVQARCPAPAREAQSKDPTKAKSGGAR